MRDRIGLALLAVALLACIGYATRRAPPRPAPPVRAARPGTGAPDDPAVRRTLAEVGEMRALRRGRAIAAGGGGDADYVRSFERAGGGGESTLAYLEEIALDRREDPGLRIDLIDILSRHPGEPTRRFLAELVGDPEEAESVRLAALAALQAYRDEATFEALRRAFEDPAPFAGRYHLCLALGENGRPEAVPVLRGAIGPSRPPEIRRHAALGLGAFVEDGAVRGELRALAAGDADPFVRQNAMSALCRSPLPEVDAFLSELEASADPATRGLARAFREQRARRP